MNDEQMADRFNLACEWRVQAGVAAATTVTLTVPAGEAWEIIGGYCSHDDPTARTAYWVHTPLGMAARVLGDVPSLATNIRSHFYTNVIMPNAPLVVHAGDTIQVVFSAMAAGQLGTITLNCRIRYGEV